MQSKPWVINHHTHACINRGFRIPIIKLQIIIIICNTRMMNAPDIKMRIIRNPKQADNLICCMYRQIIQCSKIVVPSIFFKIIIVTLNADKLPQLPTIQHLPDRHKIRIEPPILIWHTYKPFFPCQLKYLGCFFRCL